MLPRFVLAVHQPVVREEMRRFLAGRGFEVAVAADGLQCIERLQDGLPTVLVLDPHLLWGGGEGVLEWLQDEDPFAEITVVLADGGNYDSIPVRLRSLIRDCHECPGGLHDMQEFVRCLEAHAWRRSSESQPTSQCTGRQS